MDPLEMQKIGESHAYKFVWVISIAILIIAVFVGLIFWSNSFNSNSEESIKPWTSEVKKNALEALNQQVQNQGVPDLTYEEKMLILNNDKKGN